MAPADREDPLEQLELGVGVLRDTRSAAGRAEAQHVGAGARRLLPDEAVPADLAVAARRRDRDPSGGRRSRPRHAPPRRAPPTAGRCRCCSRRPPCAGRRPRARAARRRRRSRAAHRARSAGARCARGGRARRRPSAARCGRAVVRRRAVRRFVPRGLARARAARRRRRAFLRRRSRARPEGSSRAASGPGAWRTSRAAVARSRQR